MTFSSGPGLSLDFFSMSEFHWSSYEWVCQSSLGVRDDTDLPCFTLQAFFGWLKESLLCLSCEIGLPKARRRRCCCCWLLSLNTGPKEETILTLQISFPHVIKEFHQSWTSSSCLLLRKPMIFFLKNWSIIVSLRVLRDGASPICRSKDITRRTSHRSLFSSLLRLVGVMSLLLCNPGGRCRDKKINFCLIRKNVRSPNLVSHKNRPFCRIICFFYAPMPFNYCFYTEIEALLFLWGSGGPRNLLAQFPPFLGICAFVVQILLPA